MPLLANAGAYVMCTQILVWKRIKYGLMSDKEKQLLVSEVNIMRKLRHLNVVRYYDHIVDNVSADLYVITEHCENGDLGALIQLRKQQQYVCPCMYSCCIS